MKFLSLSKFYLAFTSIKLRFSQRDPENLDKLIVEPFLMLHLQRNFNWMLRFFPQKKFNLSLKQLTCMTAPHPIIFVEFLNWVWTISSFRRRWFKSTFDGDRKFDWKIFTWKKYVLFVLTIWLKKLWFMYF